MSRPGHTEDSDTQVWRACIECGNRYQPADHGYRVNWCSRSCEDASMRRQRHQIESSWLRAGWFLR